MNIQQAAAYVRSIYPGMEDADGWTKDDVVSWYVTEIDKDFVNKLSEMPNLDNEYFETQSQKAQDPFVSKSAPMGMKTFSYKGFRHGWGKNFAYRVVQGIGGVVPELATQINSLFNPDDNLTRIKQQIFELENDLTDRISYEKWYQDVKESQKNPDLKTSAGQLWRSVTMEKFRPKSYGFLPWDQLEDKLSELKMDAAILDGIVNKTDPPPGMTAAQMREGALWQVAQAFQEDILGSGYGTNFVTKWMRDNTHAAIDWAFMGDSRPFVGSDEKFKAYLKWSQDTSDLQWSDVTNIDIVSREFGNVMGSLFAIATGPGLFKAARAITTGGDFWTKTGKMKKLWNSFTGIDRKYRMMFIYGMESSELTNENADWLMKEYAFEVDAPNSRTHEIVDENGVKRYIQVGMEEDEAYAISSAASMYIGPMVTMWEGMQFNNLSRAFGKDAMSKSMSRIFLEKLLNKTSVKTYGRGYVMKTVTNMADVPLDIIENVFQEGYQQGTSLLGKEAFRHGYDVSRPYDFARLMNDMQLKGTELGWMNFINPITSEIPEIRRAAISSAFGFGASSTGKFVSGAGSDYINYKRGDAVINWGGLNDIYTTYKKNPEKYNVRSAGSGSTSTVILEDKESGEVVNMEVVPNEEMGDRIAGNLTGEYVFERGEDVINYILDKLNPKEDVPTLQQLVKKGTVKKGKNATHDFLVKLSKDSSTGQESTMNEKIYQIYTTYKGKFGLKWINEQIEQSANDPDRLDSLKKMKIKLAAEIKKRSKDNLKKNKKSNDKISIEQQDKIIDKVIDEQVDSNDKVIEFDEADRLDAHYAALLKDEGIAFDEAIESQIDKAANNQAALDEMDRNLDTKVEEAMNQLDQNNQLDENYQNQRADFYLEGDKPNTINGPDATGEQILNVLGAEYVKAMRDGKDRKQSRQAVLDYIEGKTGEKLYGGALFKVLDHLGIKYPPKEKNAIANNPKRRRAFYDKIAAHLSKDINPAPIKPKKKKKKKKTSKAKKITPKKTDADKDKKKTVNAAAEAVETVEDAVETASLDLTPEYKRRLDKLEDDANTPVSINVPGKAKTIVPRIEALRRLKELYDNKALDDGEADAIVKGLGFEMDIYDSMETVWKELEAMEKAIAENLKRTKEADPFVDESMQATEEADPFAKETVETIEAVKRLNKEIRDLMKGMNMVLRHGMDEQSEAAAWNRYEKEVAKVYKEAESLGILSMINQIPKTESEFASSKQFKIKVIKARKTEADIVEDIKEIVLKHIKERIKALDKKAKMLGYDTVYTLSLNRGNKKANTKMGKKILEAYDKILDEVDDLDWQTARLLPSELFRQWSYARGGKEPGQIKTMATLYAYLLITDNVKSFTETTHQSIPSDADRDVTIEENLEGLKRHYIEMTGADESVNKKYYDSIVEVIDEAINDAYVEAGKTKDKKKTYLSVVLDVLSRGGSLTVENEQGKIVEDKTNLLPLMKEAEQKIDKSKHAYEIERLEAPSQEENAQGIEVNIITTDGSKFGISVTGLQMHSDFANLNKEERTRDAKRMSGGSSGYAALYKIYEHLQVNPDQVQQIIFARSNISTAAEYVYGKNYDVDKDLAGANFRFLETMLEGVEDAPTMEIDPMPDSINELAEEVKDIVSEEKQAPDINEMAAEIAKENAQGGLDITDLRDEIENDINKDQYPDIDPQEIVNSIEQFEKDISSENDQKNSVSKETSTKTKNKIKRLKCKNTGG